MSENNESGNRWESTPADAGSAAEDGAAAPSTEVPAAAEDVAVPAAAATAAPVSGPAVAPRTSRLPGWVTTRGLIATGMAAAIFVGGGGIGYAIGASGHHDGNQSFPVRFDRNGFGGQMPGNGQGPNFQQGGPGLDQGQSQSRSGSSSSSGTDSGTAS